MVQLATRERVDAFWSSTLGIDAADLHMPGVRVRINPPERNNWRGVYILTFEKAACVFAPEDLLEQVSAATAELDAEAVMEQASWTSILGDQIHLMFGPVVHHYRDDRTGLDELAEGRRINPRDADAITDLRGAVSWQEWASAGFTAQPAVMFGIFEDERLLAASNLTSGPDAATDVGIVLHPDARGKGYALPVAAAAARQALQLHGVARFRALESSPPTMAIAAKLGFTEYGRNLAVYLKGEETPQI